MLEQLQEIIEYLNTNVYDPVPRYLLHKEILCNSSYTSEYSKLKESKWYLQLAGEQWDNGSWGRFHTQDTKAPVKQKFVTTETALRRAHELSLDKDDEMMNKTYRLMERYIQGQEEWLDTNEKFSGFQVAFRTIVAANLSMLEPRHPLVQIKKEICAINLTKAFCNGFLDEAIWEEESRKCNEILLRPYMGYILWLLQDNDFLDKAIERDFFEYILNRKDGIYYIAGGPLSDKLFLESKGFLTWISGLECLSGFYCFPEYMNQGTSDHLIREIRRLMNEDVILPTQSPIFGHYSETWSNKNNRRNDMVLRILRILMKC